MKLSSGLHNLFQTNLIGFRKHHNLTRISCPKRLKSRGDASTSPSAELQFASGAGASAGASDAAESPNRLANAGGSLIACASGAKATDAGDSDAPANGCSRSGDDATAAHPEFSTSRAMALQV